MKLSDDPNWDIWVAASNALQERVADACDAAGHEDFHLHYSAYETDETPAAAPIDNLDEVVAEGTFVLTADSNDFWGEGEDYVSEPITNPTWLDIAVAANASIPVTGDRHHRFLEGVSRKDNMLNMYFGS